MDVLRVPHADATVITAAETADVMIVEMTDTMTEETTDAATEEMIDVIIIKYIGAAEAAPLIFLLFSLSQLFHLRITSLSQMSGIVIIKQRAKPFLHRLM